MKSGTFALVTHTCTVQVDTSCSADIFLGSLQENKEAKFNQRVVGCCIANAVKINCKPNSHTVQGILGGALELHCDVTCAKVRNASVFTLHLSCMVVEILHAC